MQIQAFRFQVPSRPQAERPNRYSAVLPLRLRPLGLPVAAAGAAAAGDANVVLPMSDRMVTSSLLPASALSAFFSR